jgi:diguanylate cyclase (GGDEF)-like protein
VLEIRGVPLEGGGFVTTYLDVTEQRRAQSMISHMAHHDFLTDLPNRALFHDRLEQALARVKRGEQIALHYLDLDNFKPVNDILGHAVGDALLKAVAGRLSRTKRETDSVARLGGDEFVLIQTDVQDAAGVLALAGRLLDQLATPIRVEDEAVALRASVGIALFPDHGRGAEGLLEAADRALYEAKRRGGGVAVVYARCMTGN